MIRPIRPEDAAAAAQICVEALGYNTTAEKIAERTERLCGDANYYIAVYEDDTDHTVKGLLQAQRYDPLYSEDGWNIIAMAVAKRAQGQGIGRKLVEALEAHALQNGAAFVRLNSRSERAAAHAFYQRLGYRCDKLQKRFIKRLGAP